ncbi:MAG: N-acetyltransferase family protein [Alphaproteobacteria bacterium]|jgi:phosphinothricin acetyltransferase|nr:N-acetyltransferase family protein [Alphaproteobacteria bacterium]MDP6622455.1 N-acetyltransferase family protein [Alphaproteobacteria bacterium]|tara:strand:- start:866 stop:1426 length:561 start_codon:yes stop_codon:yes gene_type:complete
MTDQPAAAPPSEQPTIRDAGEDDLVRVQAIYAHHVLNGLASFELEAPDLAEIRRRFRATGAAGFPFLVAELGGDVVGFAYAGPYRPRPAYRYSVENSVYVAPEALRRGVSRALLQRLIELCQQLGARQMIAVIGDSANQASIAAHERLGFVRAGELRSVGFKHGRWVDCVIMQLPLGPGDDTLPED